MGGGNCVFLVGGASSARTSGPPPPGPHPCSLRCGLAVVMHLTNLAMITQRVSLSIAVIAMVNGTGQPAAANASEDPGRPLQELGAGVSELQGERPWWGVGGRGL